MHCPMDISTLVLVGEGFGSRGSKEVYPVNYLYIDGAQSIVQYTFS